MASIRREIWIKRPADEVWAIVTDAAAIQKWFPGIVHSEFIPSDADGSPAIRKVVLATGLKLTEEIVTNDPLIRRFQYRITGGVFREHLATVDVIEVDDDNCLAVYGTDAVPDVMALILGGASGEALENLRDLALQVATKPEEH